jgi:ribosome biogenesis GTPase
LSPTLASLGWDAQFAAEYEPHQHTHTPARVTRVDRGAVDVIAATGPLRVEIDPSLDLTVGDWVAVRDGGIDTVLTRRTAIVRAASGPQMGAQALAANVDCVLVVVPAAPRPSSW